jgi:hypothetical protein
MSGKERWMCQKTQWFHVYHMTELIKNARRKFSHSQVTFWWPAEDSEYCKSLVLDVISLLGSREKENRSPQAKTVNFSCKLISLASVLTLSWKIFQMWKDLFFKIYFIYLSSSWEQRCTGVEVGEGAAEVLFVSNLICVLLMGIVS